MSENDLVSNFRIFNEDNTKVRNFCIIAHIDHGKSTLADCFIKLCSSNKKINVQHLDNMDLERERGITIKMSMCQLFFQDKRTNNTYLLNLIDTPGHVDFSYEVLRSINACEGAILLVDATKGIQAQTISNYNLAKEINLKIIPVINKIDLFDGEPNALIKDITDLVNCREEDVILASAKKNINIEKIIQNVIDVIPSPKEERNKKILKALIFDSFYDKYLGVTFFVRIFSGEIFVNQKIKIFDSKNIIYKITRIGINLPEAKRVEKISSGKVGWITANIKQINSKQIGGTITSYENPCKEPIKKFWTPTNVVYCGIFPIKGTTFFNLWSALTKLQLSDVSFSFEEEGSAILGRGVRCGFLGVLHMEIIKERLEREYNLELLLTSPNVNYEVFLKQKKGKIVISNPRDFPNTNEILFTKEQHIEATITVPFLYYGRIMEFCKTRNGILLSKKHFFNKKDLILKFIFPISEIISNFYNYLKSLTNGYAAFDYKVIGFKERELTKIKILLNKKEVDVLSQITLKKNSYVKAKKMCLLLKNLIPKHTFEVIIQASVDNKIIAREKIIALKKNVTANLYGGDITRKKKLWAKQALGKKRMKAFGKINIPQKVFLNILNIEKN